MAGFVSLLNKAEAEGGRKSNKIEPELRGVEVIPIVPSARTATRRLQPTLPRIVDNDLPSGWKVLGKRVQGALGQHGWDGDLLVALPWE